jgi:hypothetical protein
MPRRAACPRKVPRPFRAQPADGARQCGPLPTRYGKGLIISTGEPTAGSRGSDEAAISGFQVSNPITQANASFKMRKSADPRDRVIAELQERVSALEMRSSALAHNRAGDDDFAPPRSLDDIVAVIQVGLKAGHTPHIVAQNVTHFSGPETIVKYLRERPDLQCEEFSLFRDGHQFSGFIVPKSG